MFALQNGVATQVFGYMLPLDVRVATDAQLCSSKLESSLPRCNVFAFQPLQTDKYVKLTVTA